MRRVRNTDAAVVTGTDFITQPVRDYEKAAKFYGVTLGLEFSKRWGNMPAAEFETGSLRIALESARSRSFLGHVGMLGDWGIASPRRSISGFAVPVRFVYMSGQRLRLYDYAASCNCYKIRLLLAPLAPPYERVSVDIFDGE